MGSCTAGGAYVPAMSDETIIVKGTGTIFLGGPPLVKAATGEEVTAEDLGRRRRPHALLGRRRLLRRQRRARARHRAGRSSSTLERGASPRPRRPDRAGGPHVRPGRALRHRATPIARKAYDVREIIARLVDGSRFDEFKARYGDHARHRLRPAARLPRRHHRQQRRAVLRVRAEGHALHRALRPARRAARLPAEHHRLHGRPAVRARRHREGRRQDGARRRQLGGAEVHGDHRRIVRRGQLRHVRARLRPALPLDVAERAHLGDGRRAGGRRCSPPSSATSSRARASRSPPRTKRRIRRPDPREVRAGRLAVLLDRPVVGRRHSRPGEDARRAGARPVGRVQRARARHRGSASSGCERDGSMAYRHLLVQRDGARRAADAQPARRAQRLQRGA